MDNKKKMISVFGMFISCVFRLFKVCFQNIYWQRVILWNARSKCLFRIFIHSVFRMFIQTVFFPECDYSAHTSVTLGKCVWAGSLYCGDGWTRTSDHQHNLMSLFSLIRMASAEIMHLDFWGVVLEMKIIFPFQHALSEVFVYLISFDILLA